MKKPFSIEIQGPLRETPEVGDDLTLICRVSGADDGSPIWFGPDRTTVPGIQSECTSLHVQ